MSHAQHLPGEVAWLVCEKRASGETRYYVANHGPRTRLRTLVRLIRARWSCEQAHQQLKNELGLDHFEGRSWTGLHRDALLSMIAYCFLQHLRLGGKTGRMRLSRTGPPPSPSLPQVRRSLLAMLLTWGQTCPYCQRPIRHPARE